MMNMDFATKKELEQWDNRSIYNFQFKSDTKANLDRLNMILNKSMEEFTIIYANSEPLVYKIGRYFVEQGIKNKDIEFIQGDELQTYIGGEQLDWQRKKRVDQFFEIFGDRVRNKWVIIPLMEFPVETDLAIYFSTQMASHGAIGMIFHATGDANLAYVLSLVYHNGYYYQFPKVEYKPRRAKLQDDEW
jgi:hypothetical protein